MGGYVQAYTLYSSVRPFGVTAILGGWDSEAELGVDGQVGSGPAKGAGGVVEDPAVKKGGPALYMIEPSGLYWVCLKQVYHLHSTNWSRDTTELPLAKGDRRPKPNSRSLSYKVLTAH